jgi:hypothetical protein
MKVLNITDKSKFRCLLFIIRIVTFGFAYKLITLPFLNEELLQ